jgi:hypothetical protein
MRNVEPILLKYSSDPQQGYQNVEKWLQRNEIKIQQRFNLPNWRAPNIQVHDNPHTFYQAVLNDFKKRLNLKQFKKFEGILQGFKHTAAAAFADTTPNKTTQVHGHLFIPKATHRNSILSAESASVHEVLHAIQSTILYAFKDAEHIHNYDEMLKQVDVRMNMTKAFMSPLQQIKLIPTLFKSRTENKIEKMKIFAKVFQQWETKGTFKGIHKTLSPLSLDELYDLKMLFVRNYKPMVTVL